MKYEISSEQNMIQLKPNCISLASLIELTIGLFIRGWNRGHFCFSLLLNRSCEIVCRFWLKSDFSDIFMN